MENSRKSSPYSSSSCSTYMFLSQASPLLIASIFLLLILSCSPSASAKPPTTNPTRLLVQFSLLSFGSLMLSLPSLHLSTLLPHHQCILDFSSISGSSSPNGIWDTQVNSALYFLVFAPSSP